jgi:hypothetical protein
VVITMLELLEHRRRCRVNGKKGIGRGGEGESGEEEGGIGRRLA